MIKNKEVFDVDIDKKPVKIAVVRPKQEHLAEAQKVYNKTFRDAIESGAIVRIKIEDVMRQQNLWNDEKAKEAEELLNKIMKAELKLKGGIKLSEARNIALELRRDRVRQMELLAERNRLDIHTAEAQAESARFNRLVSVCTIYDDNGKRYFNGYDDYLERADDPVALQAANRLAFMVHGLDPNYQSALPENKFLKTWKMIDEKLRLINKEGHLVDIEGRLIDENGRFIDKDKNFVDRDGNPVDAEGNYPMVEQPFLDEEGNPLLPPEDDAILPAKG